MDPRGGAQPPPTSWPASRLHVLPPDPVTCPVSRPRRSSSRPFGRRIALTAAAASTLAAGAWTFSVLRPSQAPPNRRLPATRPLVYAAIGASDAVGYGLTNPRRDAWVPQLTEQLPQPSQLLNLAVPGATISQALSQQLPRAIEAQPHLVTIWLVVNDVLEGVPIDRYATDLDALLSRLRASTTAVVAIANAPLPPASLDPRGLPEVVRRGAALAWNAVINAAATKHGAVLVDLYAKWRVADHAEYLGPDGLHPTVIGNRTLAAAFATTLRETGVI